MMSYIKQPHYTMNGLNLPGPGMDVLHTTVAYPCKYKLLYNIFLNFACFVLTCLSPAVPVIYTFHSIEMMRKDALAVRNDVAHENKLMRRNCLLIVKK